MPLSDAILSYRDLDAWKYARALVKDVYTLTAAFPAKETYGLASQLQRAAVSVPSNVAEGHSRRGTKDYIQFVSTAIGSLAEIDTQLFLAEDLDYVGADAAEILRAKIHRLQKILHGLRNSLQRKIA